MDIGNRITLFEIILLLVVVLSVKGLPYEFVFDNDKIFENCPEIPDNNGIHDLFDIKELQTVFIEGHFNIAGNVTCIWEGVQPKDRVQGHGEVYRFQRGSWQLTPISFSIWDYCKIQFNPKIFWYQFWTKNIPKGEHKCINNYGHTYHHIPFSTQDYVHEFVTNMEGRHKLVAKFEAYNEYYIRRPKTICFQICGEFIRKK